MQIHPVYNTGSGVVFTVGYDTIVWKLNHSESVDGKSVMLHCNITLINSFAQSQHERHYIWFKDGMQLQSQDKYNGLNTHLLDISVSIE